MKKSTLFSASTLAIIAFGFAAGSAAQAADTANPDIIVTATKRDQSLLSVPISVSVTSAETLQKAQVTDVLDLQSLVPSLKITQYQNPGQTDFNIRGFGNGKGNVGIESSVGVFVDGVYRSRSASTLADLPEIERIEVLRGPQSTLFGKNVSAGAISIVTKKPQFKWGGYGEVTLSNYGGILAKAMVNAPVSSTVAVRLSGSVDQRDGYFSNTVAGASGTVNNRNRYQLRGDILWQPTSDFSLRIIGDYNNINEVCCGAVSIFNGPTTNIIQFVLNKPVTNGNTRFSNNVTANFLPSTRLVGQGISAEADWNIGFAKLTSITALRNQTNDVRQDVDFTGADIANQTSSDTYKSFSQELRLASTGKGPLSWLLGAYYAQETDSTNRALNFGTDTRSYVNVLFNQLSSGALSLPGLEGLFSRPSGSLFASGQGVSEYWHMKDESYSIFGQVDYKITPQLTLTGGAAYLNDKKTVDATISSSDVFSLIPAATLANLGPSTAALLKNNFQLFPIPTNFPGGTYAAPIVGPYTGTHSGVLSGDKFVYNVRASYAITPRLNIYASYGTGWKAGAYDLSYYSTPGARSANPESVTVYEAGLKARFKGGYANIAGFIQTISNFQQNPFIGTGYRLINAGKQSVRGVEFDAVYAPVKQLTLGLNATYLDPKYDSFTNAICQDVPTTNPCTTVVQQFHDISGAVPSGIPSWTVTASALYIQELGGGYKGFIRGEYDYQSSYQLTEVVPSSTAQLNPYTCTPTTPAPLCVASFGSTPLGVAGVSTINASIGIEAPYKLSVTAWVRNLTNDRYLLQAFPGVFQPGSFSGYPNPPRTWGVTIHKGF